MAPSKRTIPKVPTPRFDHSPMNLPGPSSNCPRLNSMSASPISGTSNSSPDQNTFEHTPEQGVEKQNDNITTATQTGDLSPSGRDGRAQTCPVDLPGSTSQSNDIKPTSTSRQGKVAPSQPARVDSLAVNKTGSSETEHTFSVPALPSQNRLVVPKEEKSQSRQAGPARPPMAPPQAGFKRPYPVDPVRSPQNVPTGAPTQAQGAANSPTMRKTWSVDGQYLIMNQAGQTGQPQIAPSTSIKNTKSGAGTSQNSQKVQVPNSSVAKPASQTGSSKQSPATPARIPGPGPMSSLTFQAVQKTTARIVPARPQGDVVMDPRSDGSQSGQVGPAQVDAPQRVSCMEPAGTSQSGQAESSQPASTDSPPVPVAPQNEGQSSSGLMGPPSVPLRRSSRISKKNQEEQQDDGDGDSYDRPRMTPIRECPADEKKPKQSRKKVLRKPKEGAKHQAEIPEFIGYSLSGSESDLEEEIWICPENKNSHFNPVNVRNEYWCVIWRQFEGRILYEDALQHLMKNENSIEKAFENIEVCLKKLRPRKQLREAHLKHYKELSVEQAFDEEYYKIFDDKYDTEIKEIKKKSQKYTFTEVKEYYDLFHSRDIAPAELQKNLCICKEFFCRELSFEPRWACTNCIGQLRQMASPRFCLICKTYEELTGRTRPISGSYWSGEEVRKIFSWKCLEKKLEKEVSREDFEKHLKEKEQQRINEGNFTEEEKKFVQSIREEIEKHLMEKEQQRIKKFTEENKKFVQSLREEIKKPMAYWMQEIDNPFLKNCQLHHQPNESDQRNRGCQCAEMENHHNGTSNVAMLKPAEGQRQGRGLTK